MPEKEATERARQDAREGKSPSTQAGEFVREEMHHIREGKHGARSTKQAIAIGLSKARRTGVKLRPPKEGRDVREDATERRARLPQRADRHPQPHVHPTLPRREGCAQARGAPCAPKAVLGARRQPARRRGRGPEGAEAKEDVMKARELMTGDPTSCSPEDTIQQVAQLMRDHDCGCIPVVESEESKRLVGVITDRDIAVRCTAEGKGPGRGSRMCSRRMRSLADPTMISKRWSAS